MSREKWSMKHQMLLGIAMLIILNGSILTAIALLFAPSIFHEHLSEAGVTSPLVIEHVTHAYISSFRVSMTVAGVISLLISAFFAWFFILRITEPIQNARVFAENIAKQKPNAQDPAESAFPELNELSESLRKMSANLDEAQGEQTRLLHDLAHEIRNPISTILATVDGIEDGVINPSAKTWQTIRDQLQRVNRLSNDLREVTISNDSFAGEVIQVAPSMLVESAHTAWVPRIGGKEISFNLTVQQSLPRIYVDPQRIGQVLSNLLENALRHTPRGGSISVEVLKTSTEVHFIVSDNGEGISTENLSRIFERLFRADVSRRTSDSGSGLGLTIARTIAENHHGSLTATSEGIGKGTSFTLALPF